MTVSDIPGLAAGVFILLSRGQLKRNPALRNHRPADRPISHGARVIALTRLNGKKFVLNADLIRYVESTPDTMVTLLHGEKIMVQESIEDVVARAIQYQRQARAFPL